MSDIFISYASEDHDKAGTLAEALGARGWSVWWDRKIPLGQSFDEVIESALGSAKCVIALWSAHAIASKWVKNEASDADGRGILVPVFIEEVHAPLAFRRLNGADLHDWQPGTSHPEFDKLIERVSALLETDAHIEVLPPTPMGLSPSAPVLEMTDLGHRSSLPRLAAVSLLLVGLIAAAYALGARRSASPESAPLASPAAREPAARSSSRPSVDTGTPGTSTRPSAGGTAASAGATSSGASSSPDPAGALTSTVGQITLKWNGDNALTWKVVDASRKTTFRNEAVGARGSRTVDLQPGNYVVVLDHPNFQPIPATVTAGNDLVLTPTVGQITLKWNGDNAITWKVVDASRKTTFRNEAVGARGSRTVDLQPGNYVVVLDHPDFQPIPATVTAGNDSVLTPTVGQITLKWNGDNVLTWKVVDASRKTTFRNEVVGARGSRTVDLQPGNYVVVLDYPDFQPIPAKVTGGDAQVLTPVVGQITFKWSGANALLWKVLDVSRKTTLRNEVVGARASRTVDLPPGMYVLVLDLPEFAPIPVTVRPGEASAVAR